MVLSEVILSRVYPLRSCSFYCYSCFGTTTSSRSSNLNCIECSFRRLRMSSFLTSTLEHMSCGWKDQKSYWSSFLSKTRFLISFSVSLNMLKILVDPLLANSFYIFSSLASLTFDFLELSLVQKESLILVSHCNMIKCIPYLESLNKRFF